MVTLVQFNSSL